MYPCGLLAPPGALPIFRARPPGLIEHVLTVLVSGPGCSSCPGFHLRLGASDCFSGLAFCFMGPWTFAQICCPQLPYHPNKNGTHSTCFTAQGSTRRNLYRQVANAAEDHTISENREGCGCSKFLAGKVFRQISMLLENSSPIFRQHEILSLPRFGHFPARNQNCLQWGRSNLGDPAESREICLLNRDFGNIFVDFSQEKQQNTEFTKFSLVRTPEIY